MLQFICWNLITISLMLGKRPNGAHKKRVPLGFLMNAIHNYIIRCTPPHFVSIYKETIKGHIRCHKQHILIKIEVEEPKHNYRLEMASDRSNMVLVLLLIVMVMKTISDAQNSHTVGDSIGWTIPPNANTYSTWAASQTFAVGDTLGNLFSVIIKYLRKYFIDIFIFYLII